MPTHLDVLCGHYRDVLVHNQKALETDRRFLAYSDDPGVYLVYVIHNFHFAIYGAMFLGQYTPAIAAAEELIATIPEAVLRIQSPPMADFLEGYLTMKQHVLVRFGKWREIIEQELPAGSRPLLLERCHDPLRQGGRAFGARQCRRGRGGEGVVRGGEGPGAREPPRPQQP